MENETVTEFIDKLPSRIEWIKKDTRELKGADDGYKDYYIWFFNIWKILDYTPELRHLAFKASEVVYHIALDGKPMYKHFENCMSYEMSEEAKRVYWCATDIYTYVIWLQKPELFPNVTRFYCERIYKKWIKEPLLEG